MYEYTLCYEVSVILPSGRHTSRGFVVAQTMMWCDGYGNQESVKAFGDGTAFTKKVAVKRATRTLTATEEQINEIYNCPPGSTEGDLFD